MTDPLLELEKVNAGYTERLVIKDITFSVSKASLAVLIGPNGHGKTTALQCISGLLRPRDGEIRFAGERLNEVCAEDIVARGVVHIPQGDLLFSEMTVRDNLLMGAYLPAARARLSDQLEKVFSLLPILKERQKQIASSLSGGERRMLAIGRGLMSQSRILLIDEPSLGLAPIVIDQIYDLMRHLKEEGRTILLVEEHAGRAMKLADQIFLMDEGRLVWEGGVQELMERKEIIETYLGA